jgi:hypothetical protein
MFYIKVSLIKGKEVTKAELTDNKKQRSNMSIEKKLMSKKLAGKIESILFRIPPHRCQFVYFNQIFIECVLLN